MIQISINHYKICFKELLITRIFKVFFDQYNVNTFSPLYWYIRRAVLSYSPFPRTKKLCCYIINVRLASETAEYWFDVTMGQFRLKRHRRLYIRYSPLDIHYTVHEMNVIHVITTGLQFLPKGCNTKFVLSPESLNHSHVVTIHAKLVFKSQVFPHRNSTDPMS